MNLPHFYASVFFRFSLFKGTLSLIFDCHAACDVRVQGNKPSCILCKDVNTGCSLPWLVCHCHRRAGFSGLVAVILSVSMWHVFIRWVSGFSHMALQNKDELWRQQRHTALCVHGNIWKKLGITVEEVDSDAVSPSKCFYLFIYFFNHYHFLDLLGRAFILWICAQIIMLGSLIITLFSNCIVI